METRIVIVAQGGVPLASGLKALQDMAAIVLPGCHVSFMLDDMPVQLSLPTPEDHEQWQGQLVFGVMQ